MRPAEVHSAIASDTASATAAGGWFGGRSVALAVRLAGGVRRSTPGCDVTRGD